MFKYILGILPALFNYKLSRIGIIKPRHPIILNFSITNKCQSRCTTCNIWQLYEKNPKKEKEELKLWEIEKLFKTMKPVFLLNICGGEPSLRNDLGDICALATKYIKPKVIHFPTNCLSPEKVEFVVKDILAKISKETNLTVKLSLDGIGADHDKIRGVEGNFEKLLETHDCLVKIREKNKNFYLDAGTTISKKNLNKLPQIIDYVNKNLKLDNFLHEIADTRAELFNISDKNCNNHDFKEVVSDLKVTPRGEQYSSITDYLCEEVKKDMKGKRALSRITQALRIAYYKRAGKAMKNKKRVVPCYAGISNAHLNPWGDLWICNVQAFKKSMGNVKDYNYDFDKLWNSLNARKIRKWVKEEHCYCPLVGQAFLDTMMHPIELIKVLWYYLVYR